MFIFLTNEEISSGIGNISLETSDTQDAPFSVSPSVSGGAGLSVYISWEYALAEEADLTGDFVFKFTISSVTSNGSPTATMLIDGVTVATANFSGTGAKTITFSVSEGVNPVGTVIVFRLTAFGNEKSSANGQITATGGTAFEGVDLPFDLGAGSEEVNATASGIIDATGAAVASVAASGAASGAVASSLAATGAVAVTASGAGAVSVSGQSAASVAVTVPAAVVGAISVTGAASGTITASATARRGRRSGWLQMGW